MALVTAQESEKFREEKWERGKDVDKKKSEEMRRRRRKGTVDERKNGWGEQ